MIKGLLRFGGVAALTNPERGGRAGLAGDAHIALQAVEHGGAHVGQRQAVAQQVDEIPGAQIGADQVAAGGAGADHQVTLAAQHIAGNHDALAGLAVALLGSFRALTLKRCSLPGFAVVGVGQCVDSALEREAAHLAGAHADVSVAADRLNSRSRCSVLLSGALADSGQHILHGISFAGATFNQALGQIISFVLTAECRDGGNARALIGRSLRPHRLEIEGSVFHLLGCNGGLGLGCGRSRSIGIKRSPDTDGGVSCARGN